MRSILPVILVALTASGIVSPTQADEKQAQAIVDQAIQASGGEAKLSKAKALAWKTKGTLHFGDNESKYTAQATLAGLDKFRQEFEGEFGGNPVKGVVVLNGNQGWRKFGETSMQLDADAAANEKRTVYLQAIGAATLLPLKSADFRIEAAGDEKVGDADAAGIKVTAGDGKDFKIFFDKESKLPVKVVARVRGFDGSEFTQETIYSDFKDFDGIKKATKIQSTRDGQVFLEAELIEFKTLNEVAPDAFAEPK
jgi:outer membrane lipoprotein-sorting protein